MKLASIQSVGERMGFGIVSLTLGILQIPWASIYEYGKTPPSFPPNGAYADRFTFFFLLPSVLGVCVGIPASIYYRPHSTQRLVAASGAIVSLFMGCMGLALVRVWLFGG